jgi:cobalt/nickel transport system ATP-binding protein
MSALKGYTWRCAPEDTPMKKAVEIKNLSFSYPDGNRALADISLDIDERESVGVIGPNGAGKSTLLLHLNGLLNENSNIKIFDKPIVKENIAFIRKKVGFVFQDPLDQLFMPTAYEDVAFGPLNLGLSQQEVDKRVDYALSAVDLLDKKNHSSHHLSLGQQRRLSLATVLSMSPDVLVLDEPNSNLDHSSRRHLINLLKNFSVTKIIATHDLEMVLELCNKVFLLDSGALIKSGDTKQILSDKDLLQAHGLEVPLSLLS